MITVEEAKQKIAAYITTLPPVTMPLSQAAGKILAENIYAKTDIPAFEQSAMDGYAFSYKDRAQASVLKVVGELQAGAGKAVVLEPGQAARIFTGAPLPVGADTVVIQERISLNEDGLIIEDEKLAQGANVRRAGSEVKAGALVLEKDTVLTPAAIGLIAGIGMPEITVYPEPSIAIIVTGKELQTPGNSLHFGQVYESNSFTLLAALQQIGITDVRIRHADDDLSVLTNVLGEMLETVDMVLLTGGVSVGDYDFVLQAAADCGIEKVFHKVKQRPGKPLYFGMRGVQPVFGLPGNPSSVLTCFYQYVLPAIEGLTKRSLQLKKSWAPIRKAYDKQHTLVHFLKGFYDGEGVEVLEAQESYRLRSFAKANCLVMLGEVAKTYEPGERVVFYLI